MEEVLSAHLPRLLFRLFGHVFGFSCFLGAWGAPDFGRFWAPLVIYGCFFETFRIRLAASKLLMAAAGLAT